MSFGKDPNNLAGVVQGGASFQQQAAASLRRPKKQAGGGGGGKFFSYRDQFKPSDVNVDTGRIIPGSYVSTNLGDDGNTYGIITAYVTYDEHFHGTLQRGTICSAGPFWRMRNKRNPCRGCDIFWEDYEQRKRLGKGVKGPNRVSRREMFAFNWLDMGVFHKTNVLQPDGQPLINRNSGLPIWNWVKCIGIGCPGCSTGVESKRGHMMPWPMGKQHFETINGYAEYIANGCLSCGERDSISTVSWHCANPGCGEAIVDLRNTTMNAQQVNEMIAGQYHCRKCQTSALPIEAVYCANCTPTGVQPVRASLFDVDMQVQRRGGGDSKGTQLVVLDTSDPKPIDPRFVEIAKPLDLAARYAPTPYDEQVALFGPPTPTGPSVNVAQPQYGAAGAAPPVYAPPAAGFTKNYG